MVARVLREDLAGVRPSTPRKNMINKEQSRQYFVSFLAALGVSVVFALYLFLRRGYFNLYIFNKVLASTSLVLLGIVLLIGPISRFYNRFDKWLILRREIGIMAFLLALGHGLISYSGKASSALIWGIISLAILAVLFLTSYKFVESKLNRGIWIQLQSWGVRLGTFFAFLHLIALKYPGWIKWLAGQGAKGLVRPEMPPASLLGALFLGFVAITRLAEIFGVKIARKIFEAGIIILLLAI